MASTNSFVRYLTRYTTVSPEHEAAFDEFITQSAPLQGEPLRITTKVQQFLEAIFTRANPPSIILTGNAGDGKTYLCRKVIERLTGQPVTDWQQHLERDVAVGRFTLRVVKDLSEMGEQNGVAALRALNSTLDESMSGQVFLIAANEGRLRALLVDAKLITLYEAVNAQLVNGPDLAHPQLIVLDLNRVTTSTFVAQALAWMTNAQQWQACKVCPAVTRCPIHWNAQQLANAHIAARVQMLYQVLEHLDLHVTIRDMLIHLAYTITGELTCETVLTQPQAAQETTYLHVYYENIWGEQASDAFRQKTTLVHHLRQLNVGASSIFTIDDFIVNGNTIDAEQQAQHQQLFAPDLDLGQKQFQQDRAAYLQGGVVSPHPNKPYALLDWLSHCRRKLFFEWQNVELANRLLPFLALPEYLRLLQGEEADLERFRRRIVLGLNRAFAGLYLTDDHALYVTSQYAHSGEQTAPIVQCKIPTDYLRLEPRPPQHQDFDDQRIILQLEIPPPPRVRAEPVIWPVNLLRFEYLLRRAGGGTPNILAAECELLIRQLKDHLLTTFAREGQGELIEFFAARRHGYTLAKLRLDKGKIRAEV
jgi:hypothetical protein